MTDNKRHFAVVVGTRPNFVKVVPFFKEAKNHPEYRFTLIHTGQHFDEKMSQVFFEAMEIPRPEVHFAVTGEFHTERIGNMFTQLRDYFFANKFSGVIVVGDVNSTLAGAIAAIKNNQRLIHIEAGLRSHDRRMPEEINRAIVDHLSDLLFTTEPAGIENLKKEGINPNKIRHVGNIMIETMEIFWPQISQSKILETLNLQSKSFVVATIHRQENIDDRRNIEIILHILNETARHSPVVFPIHPGTQKKLQDYNLAHYLSRLKVIEPLGYFDFIKLTSKSEGVITDSGGIQEETTHLGVACATLRDNTERPITVELGSNRLFPVDLVQTNEMINHLTRRDFKSKHIPLWDNQVSKRIFEHLDSF